MLSVKATILAAVSAAAIQDFDFEYETIKAQFSNIFDGDEYLEMEGLLDDVWEQFFWWGSGPVVIEPIDEREALDDFLPIDEPEPVIDEPEPIVSMPVEPEPSTTCQ